MTGVLRTLPFAVAMFLFSIAARAQLIRPPALDLAVNAEVVERAGTPLIVMVSLSGCRHCDGVKRSHLLPLLSAREAVMT